MKSITYNFIKLQSLLIKYHSLHTNEQLTIANEQTVPRFFKIAQPQYQLHNYQATVTRSGACLPWVEITNHFRKLFELCSALRVASMTIRPTDQPPVGQNYFSACFTSLTPTPNEAPRKGITGLRPSLRVADWWAQPAAASPVGGVCAMVANLSISITHSWPAPHSKKEWWT